MNRHISRSFFHLAFFLHFYSFLLLLLHPSHLIVEVKEPSPKGSLQQSLLEFINVLSLLCFLGTQLNPIPWPPLLIAWHRETKFRENGRWTEVIYSASKPGL